MDDIHEFHRRYQWLAMLDLHKLHIFLTVARLGSFTRAAEALHMTQPTVSQQVAVLESSLGIQLIDRNTRHLKLTQPGTVLADYSERLIALSHETVVAVQAEAGIARHSLKLGVGHTLATYLLPGILSQYRALHSDYRVRLNIGNTAELLAMLAASEIDVALVGSPAEHPDVVVEPFMQDRLVVIVSPQDEWAAFPSVTLNAIAGRLLFTREPGSALYATVARLLGAERLLSPDTLLLGETEAIKRSVELGLGVALIQKIAVEREVQQGSLRAIPLAEADDARTYLVAFRKRYVPNEAVSAFVQVLR